MEYKQKYTAPLTTHIIKGESGQIIRDLYDEYDKERKRSIEVGDNSDKLYEIELQLQRKVENAIKNNEQ